MKGPGTSAMNSWEQLNKRQQAYLTAVFEVDQAIEQGIKADAARGYWNSTPASVWRWMPYNASGAALLRKVQEAGYQDHGTGSTFAALERRGLILCRYERDALDLPILFVQITKAGRKMVRQALNLKAPKALPHGTLREWHWKALALAWKAQPKGILKEVLYGNISWNTWLRLRDYKDGDLVYEREVRRPNPSGWHFSDYYMCLTAFGKQYYRDNWQRYREMYPDVDAPEPT